ncbi:MAG: aminoacetone oxidase family FAD-binding enzyme [Planctomycetota bacterium JB042]
MSTPRRPTDVSDVLVIGAGAAGTMAAIAARGAVDDRGEATEVPGDAPSVRLLDGAPKIGLKILVSGGGRCNVTNEAVDERDYESDAPKVVRGTLRGFPPAAVRTFFASRGCPLYAEPLGKLFPTTDRARDVLATLLEATERSGAALERDARVVDVERDADRFVARTDDGREFPCRRLIVATGGKSLPRTGSRGFGFELAARLGHAVVAPLPALTPLFLGDDSPLASLAGVTVPATLSLVPRGAPPEQVGGRRFRPLARAAGSLLVTHRGASGPAALDVSGAVGRALEDGTPVTLEADFVGLALGDSPWSPFRDARKPPGASLPPAAGLRPVDEETFRAAFAALVASDPRRSLGVLVARLLPRSLGDALLRRGGLDPGAPPPEPSDPARAARLHRALAHADLRVVGTDGFDKAEVTAGGVPLRELHRTTLESRLVPGLHFCGEVAHCTGRLGGFNFQWAWSSGFAAGRAAARRP